MKPNLILHIGSPKTGTSSIQRTLINNKELLAQHGYHYLECLQWHDGAHHELAFSIRELSYNNKRKCFSRCLDELKEEVSKLNDGIECVIISSEILFYDIKNNLESFKKVTSLFNKVTIVVSLRSPTDYLTSLYKQMVRDPNDRLEVRPSVFIKNKLNTINYEEIIGSYEKPLGSEGSVILKYDENITENFFKKILGINNFTYKKINLNTTLDGAELKIKLKCNSEIKDFKKNKESLMRIKQFCKKEKLLTRKTNIFTKEEVLEIEKAFIKNNKNLLNSIDLISSDSTINDFNFQPVSVDVYDKFKTENFDLYE